MRRVSSTHLTLPLNAARLHISPLILQAQHTAQLSNLDTLQSLCQKVSWHLCCRAEHRTDRSSTADIAQPVHPQVQVLEAAKVLRILGNRDSRVVVDVHSGRLVCDRVAQLSEEVAHPTNLLASFHCSDVLSLCARQSHNGLQLAAPIHRSSANPSDIGTCRPTIVLVTTVICIREDCEQLLRRRIRGIDEFQVHGGLQIAKEVLDSGPVLFARIGVEASELRDSEGDVWTSTSSQIHQGSHSIDVWQLAHLSALLSIRGTHLFRKAQARLHRSVNRSAATESEPLKHVDDVLTLRE